jgi:cytochrome P450
MFEELIFMQADSYTVITAITNGREVASLISARPESRHTSLKKPVMHAFTPNAVLDHEHYVDQTCNLLVQRLEECGPPVDLAEWTRYWAMDTLSGIAFSEDLGFMADRKDVEGTFAAIGKQIDHWTFWNPLPQLERLVFKNAYMLSIVRPSTAVARLAARKMEGRLNSERKIPQHDLLSQYLMASEKHPEELDRASVLGLTISTINAGADTTANTLALTLYQLARDPSKYKKLERELSTANLSEPPKLAELNKLPYLDAVIKESMRLNPIFDGPMERLVPPDGLDIAGMQIPGGTTVSVSQHVIHRDPTIYGSEVDFFVPERWIDAERDHRRIMERAFLGFGAGKRMCLGQHFALMELKKIVSKMTTTFKVTPIRSLVSLP